MKYELYIFTEKMLNNQEILKNLYLILEFEMCISLGKLSF